MKVKKVLLVGSMGSMIFNFNVHNILLLKNMGVEVHVAANFGSEDPISPEKRQQMIQFFEQNKIQFFSVNFLHGMGNFKQNRVIIAQLKQIISQNKYDFVHTNSPLASVLVRIAAKNMPTKVLYMAHGFQFYKGGPKKDWLLFYSVEKAFARFTEAIITINEEDYQQALKMGYKKVYKLPGVGIDTKKIKTMDGYKKVDLLNNLGFKESRDKDCKLIISIGELNQNKNQELVLRAIENMKNREKIVYIICGTGDKKAEYEKFIKNHKLNDCVALLGYRTDVIQLIKASDLVILPSYREGLPVAIMEAMASGVPVLASDIRGVRDLVVDGKGGFLFDPYDVDSLVNVLDNMVIEDSALQSFGRFNQDRIKLFDQKIVNQKMQQIYESLLE